MEPVGKNYLATPQSPVHGSLEVFSQNPVEEPDFHQQNNHIWICVDVTHSHDSKINTINQVIH